MENLPSPLIIEVFNRLNDASDLARCRSVCKSFLQISHQANSLFLICSSDRHLKSRAPETKSITTPFKSIVNVEIARLNCLQTLSIGVENSYRETFDSDEDPDADDLNLTAVDFVSEWLPRIAGKLRSLSITDFWIQSCWRCSEILLLVSSCCEGLLSLELKNAWLSVKGLKPMPMLAHLTLEYIRLDDEDLNKVNDCFPGLQTLNLIDVGGLKQPTIHLFQLTTCQLIVSNAPASLTIYAPKLIKLKLRCVCPDILAVKAPLLSFFDLSIAKPGNIFEIERFHNLKTLRVQSSNLHSLKQLILGIERVQQLFLEIPTLDELPDFKRTGRFEELGNVFPNLGTLELGPGISSKLFRCFNRGELKVAPGLKLLKRLLVHWVMGNVEVTFSFISFLLNQFAALSEVAVLVHSNVSYDTKNHIISKCLGDFPRIKWKWGSG